MPTGQECVNYARECVRFAEMTKDFELRDHLLDLAREWMATANDELRVPEPKS
jgi:NADH:ubiquinone oxidoreductase subunit D